MHRLAILLSCLSLAASASAEEAHQLARQHFERAQAAEAEGRLEQALDEYQRADEARGSYRLHRHIGRVCEGLGRRAEALRHYESFFEGGGDQVQPHWRREIGASIERLRGQVGSLRISAPESATVLVDGQMLGGAPLEGMPRWMDPGRYLIEVRMSGYLPWTEWVEIAAGEEQAVAARLDPETTAVDRPDGSLDETSEDSWESGGEARPEPRSRRRLSRGLFWATFGASLALLTVGGVCGGLALAEEDTFEGIYHDRANHTEAEYLASADRGRELQISADVMLFTGAAAAVAALVLAFFTDFSGDRASSASGTSLAILPNGLGAVW